jgi:hypothetical protein
MSSQKSRPAGELSYFLNSLTRKGSPGQRTIAENLAWLRRFTLSLLKQHPGKDSLAMKRRICGWSDDFLMEVLGIKGT